MNLSEVVRSQALINGLANMPMLKRSSYAVEESTRSAALDWQTVNWQSCAAGLAMLGFGYRLMRALRNKFRSRKCTALVSLRSKRIARRNEISASSSSSSSSNPESNVSAEICPICLEPPRIGVRTGCDHRMCAACLRRYCEIHAADHKRNRPPPCPLCRTPLVAVTLMYSQINNEHDYYDAVDTETAAWIGKFNASGGRWPACNNQAGFFANNARLLISILLATLLVCTVARFQEVSGIDLTAYSSFFLAAFGMTLMSCLWFKCHGEEEEEEEEEEEAILEVEY